MHVRFDTCKGFAEHLIEHAVEGCAHHSMAWDQILELIPKWPPGCNIVAAQLGVPNAMERYERLMRANPQEDAVGATVNTLLYADKRPKGTLVAPLPLQIEEGKVAFLEGLLPPVTARQTYRDERVIAKYEPSSSKKYSVDALLI